MDNWKIAIFIYIFLATASFFPVLIALLKKVKLNPGGKSFENSPHFSDDNRKLLSNHFSRINGTLIFWKNKAEWNRRFHFYTLIWSIPISITIPILTQMVDSDSSILFLTIISTHSALLIGFHRALKIENNYKAFRHGESEFYDLYRRILDRPKSFGKYEHEQVENYFKEAEQIRRYVRNAETDNFPMIDDIKKEITTANNV
jgi:hypothetical protein